MNDRHHYFSRHHEQDQSRGAHTATLSPGPSLLRMPAAVRFGGAVALAALVWALTLAVLG